MSFVLKPWKLWVVAVAGWINQQQQQAIEYLRTENRVLKETHGKKRIILNDDQRRRLAVKGKVLGVGSKYSAELQVSTSMELTNVDRTFVSAA